MIRTNREVLQQQLYERLDAETRELRELVPGLDCDGLEVHLDADAEPLVTVDWGLTVKGRSACLRDDLVEALLARVALLTGPMAGVVTTAKHVVEIRVRGR